MSVDLNRLFGGGASKQLPAPPPMAPEDDPYIAQMLAMQKRYQMLESMAQQGTELDPIPSPPATMLELPDEPQKAGKWKRGIGKGLDIANILATVMQNRKQRKLPYGTQQSIPGPVLTNRLKGKYDEEMKTYDDAKKARDKLLWGVEVKRTEQRNKRKDDLLKSKRAAFSEIFAGMGPKEQKPDNTRYGQFKRWIDSRPGYSPQEKKRMEEDFWSVTKDSEGGDKDTRTTRQKNLAEFKKTDTWKVATPGERMDYETGFLTGQWGEGGGGKLTPVQAALGREYMEMIAGGNYEPDDAMEIVERARPGIERLFGGGVPADKGGQGKPEVFKHGSFRPEYENTSLRGFWMAYRAEKSEEKKAEMVQDFFQEFGYDPVEAGIKERGI